MSGITQLVIILYFYLIRQEDSNTSTGNPVYESGLLEEFTHSYSPNSVFWSVV